MRSLRRRKTPQITARDFFSRLCPLILGHRRALCEWMTSVVTFHIRGEGGGIWTIDLAKAHVAAEMRSDALVTVEMDAQDFSQLANGTLDGFFAQKKGRLTCTGELRRLAELGIIFRAIDLPAEVSVADPFALGFLAELFTSLGRKK